jgi:hypothetical protein
MAGVAAMALGTTVSTLPGQQPTALDSVVAEQLAHGRLVRLSAAGIASTGHLRSFETGVAVMATDTGLVRVPLAGIDRVWTRGGSAGTGALLGGAVGAILGAVVGASAFTDGITCDGTAECPAGKRIRNGLAGAVVVGLPTALLGAGIGAVIPRWKLRYPVR